MSTQINRFEEKVLESRLIPQPQVCSFMKGVYKLRDECHVEVSNTGTDSKKLILQLFTDYWNVTPRLQFIERQTDLPEAYEISVKKNTLRIVINDEHSLRYAFYTLRQLAEAERNQPELTGYLLPCCEIKDKPDLAFRAIHMCVFPETDLIELEKRIKLAAYYKFNYLVLEFWGTFPFECCRALCLDEWFDKKEQLRNIIKETSALGLTVIPQFNILGHAAGARSASDKHIILDYHPELQPLFEPEAWSWCLSNKHTRTLLKKAVMEMHNFFGCPPFFHIGCDEAEDLGHCALCRKQNVRKLVSEHINFFHNLFAERSTRIIMWHDIMLEEDDPRFPDVGTRNGLKEFSFGKLYQEIPKDIIVAVWCYGGEPPTDDYDYKAIRFFKEADFSVLVSPWKNPGGINSIVEYAIKNQMDGVLATMWNSYNSLDLFNIFSNSSQSAWNRQFPRQPAARLSFTTHLRHIIWDLKIRDYLHTGSSEYQVAVRSITPSE